jgi:bifunctional DNase/RNase
MAMALKECTIESVRRFLRIGEWIILLRDKDKEQYLPICIGQNQANIVKRELIHDYKYYYESKYYERFLAGTDIFMSTLESVVVSIPQDLLFSAKLVIKESGESHEIDCPVAGALALAFRREAKILVDETTFQEAGISLAE